MYKKFREFLEELFEGKQYSWIYDMETKMLYFNPHEVLKDAGYTKRAIEDKVLDLNEKGKRKFTNKMLTLDTV